MLNRKKLDELQSQEDIARVKIIAEKTITAISIAADEASLEERVKNASILRDSIFALKSIANETDTMQKAAKISNEINKVVKIYNAYIKQIKKEKTADFIKKHVEII